MEEDIVEKEIRKELNCKEKIVTYIFKKTFSKIYIIVRKRIVNNILQ